MISLLAEIKTLEELVESQLSGNLLNIPEISAEELAIIIQEGRAHSDYIVLASPSQTVADLVGLLNNGVLAVVVSDPVALELLQANVPTDRIIVQVPNASAAREIIVQGLFYGVSLKNDIRTEEIRELVNVSEANVAQTGKLVSVIVEDAASIYAEIGRAIPVIGYSQLTRDHKNPMGRVPVSEVILSKMGPSERADGLYTTIVTNTYGQLLGTCFSSHESVREAIKTGTGVYHSRKRGIWYKGASSGNTQKLLAVHLDCDSDALQFVVEQEGSGFCHNNTYSCFGPARGLTALSETLKSRRENAPEGSYTKRLFEDSKLLRAKIMEEAEEFCDAKMDIDVSWEAADLLYFVMVKLTAQGLTLQDVENNLDIKGRKLLRRPGNAKKKWIEESAPAEQSKKSAQRDSFHQNRTPEPVQMHVVDAKDPEQLKAALRRPAQSSAAFDLTKPIVEEVRRRGDAALLEYTAKFDGVELQSPVMNAPFAPDLMAIEPNMQRALDLAIENVHKFHAAQLTDDLVVETSPGVTCSRYSRPIERVGLYVPGGSAILPSTAVMLGVPAMVAGCKDIVIASPPRKDGTLAPEVVYVAHKVGASQIVLAGGGQAVAAMAYGTNSVTKVDKIFGPGNQFVTAAKMMVQTDLNAKVSIDMPAGPSEVLVIADRDANKTFVVADLLSQAEHGPDSQVILLAIGWTTQDIEDLQGELDAQANVLPRVDTVRKSIKHSTILCVDSEAEAMRISNLYAPEHLIIQTGNAGALAKQVECAGSVFVGALSPEACGDYSSGTNHTLPTYGYAKQYSGTNTSMYLKHITSQELTPQGIASIGPETVALARKEELEAHANAVVVRLKALGLDVEMC